MNKKLILPLDDQQAELELAGGKGASLARLARAGMPVPGGFHVTTLAYDLFVADNQLLPRILHTVKDLQAADTAGIEAASQEIRGLFAAGVIAEEIIQAVILGYQELPGTSPAVAVRSSATAEDLPQASFAGQQDSFLNVSSEQALLEAIRSCWASLWTPRAISYRLRQQIAPGKVSLAVVVQLLVPADVSGILFTANPLNGNRHQILINASWGLGEAIVGGLVTPDAIVVEKGSGSLVSYDVADKSQQTVRMNGGTQEIPVPVEKRWKPVLDKKQAADLARLGEQIESLYQMPMDIEWGMAGQEFYILQARPITVLTEQELVFPEEWKLPDGAYAAMRNNIVELMADPLTPLFKTLGLKAVNRSMGSLLSGFLGSQEVMPGELIIAVNEYAYYNGSVRFVPMLKIIIDTPGIMQRMFRGAVERWTEMGRPNYVRTVEKWEETDWKAKPAAELLEGVEQLTGAAVDAYGSLVSGVIPAAWISEAWFTFIYRFVGGKNDPQAPTFLMGFDSLPIQAEKSLFDVARWVQEDELLADYMERSTAEMIAADLDAGQPPDGVAGPAWQEWQERFQDYLGKYGHMIYNLDFGSPVPADEPTPLLEALKLFVRGEGTDPYQRQAATAERRAKAVEALTSRLRGYRLKLFQVNLERAQRYAPLREDGLADVGLSYPMLRQILSELGRRFASEGLISQAQDIYWLEEAEVVSAAGRYDRGEPLEDLCALVRKRKMTWESAANAAPPLMLPQLKIFGFDLMSLKAGRTKEDDVISLKGVAASPGKITARASVLRGPEDFSKMETGSVLVASMTTPAWTPLFARAAAVVTDIGGPLSHGSIVAREYGIPAVLGTDSATKSIQHGQKIDVDGNRGIVTLVETG